ncbi:MAG: type II toxin-antitoxin system RelE/ParE family toxin [Acidobacteria bacterium]|nr:type II toxin-antitoxin system RelE/ParE family toxin [Acidobacteriota bacterium]
MKLVVRPAAREDILRQYRYYLIEQGAEAAAERFLVAVQDAIDQVLRRPGVGTPKVINKDELRGLRSWPAKGFSAIRVYYLVTNETIRVVRVLHGKRDLGQLLGSGE